MLIKGIKTARKKSHKGTVIQPRLTKNKFICDNPIHKDEAAKNKFICDNPMHKGQDRF